MSKLSQHLNETLQNWQQQLSVSFSESEEALLYSSVENMSEEELLSRIQTAEVVLREEGLNATAVAAILLQGMEEEQVAAVFSPQVCVIIRGLERVADLYKHNNTDLESENFRKLLLALAEDVRVVLIIIAQRVALMRRLNELPSSRVTVLNAEGKTHDYTREVKNMARETSFLYAPLAHRLGLYSLKTELEDLSLKFQSYTIYKDIARALNEKKEQRDAYIAAFIAPVENKLRALGLDFHIKGRTKSIHSIYNKMQKQQCGVDGIYDLFAIRVILHSSLEREKADCWQAYSVVADMYQPNPKRLRDWLSIPKSNGYESLHTTVLGPENKWVEVQIRSERMDEVAEKGVAAHWKYKGGKAETGMDEFLKGVREMLESDQVDNREAISEFRLNLYDQEVFVFTPNGDLHKLPKGATVLDFAFAIHSGLGCKCMGGKIGGRNVPIKHVLHNGDQVEILTSPMQRPNESWLKIVQTSKAKNKIRQALKEVEYKQAAEGKELLERRFKNWKIEASESKISALAKKAGYKAVSDFYQAVALGREDLLAIKDRYVEMTSEGTRAVATASVSADQFVQTPEAERVAGKQDALVIDQNLKNVDYKLAKCCNPIYGDAIFGFVSVTSGIKIHRCDCPNAKDMQERFPYRVVPARWSGKAVGQQYPITLRVVGHDDIGIVSGITSLINKEPGVLLRTISIDSHDGIFEGHLTLLVSSTEQLSGVQKRLQGVKGVKGVERA